MKLRRKTVMVMVYYLYDDIMVDMRSEDPTDRHNSGQNYRII